MNRSSQGNCSAAWAWVHGLEAHATGLLVCAAICAGAAWGEKAAPTFESDVRPLVEMFCLDCHNAVDLKGNLNLERFQTMEMAVDSLAIWQRIGKRLEGHEMPPKKAPQPNDEERGTIVAWVNSLKLDEGDCNHIASEETVSWYPGYAMSRRLNRHEYENTLRDLLGVKVDVADLFPADGAGGEGFDTTGNALFLSAIQVEKYLDAADLSVEQVLPPERRRALRPSAASRGGERPNTPATADEKQLVAIRDTLIAAAPGWKKSPRDAAARSVSAFAERAWRRRIQPEELERLLGMFDQAYARGDGFENAVKFAFKAALVSPNFLFLAEPEPEQPGVYELGNYPLASRLSYFIWGSMPDEELFALAAEGILHEPEVLAAQVSRMLRDPKAKALGELFAAQWLGISQLGETTRPDAERFPQFDDALRDDMRKEAAAMFNWVVINDRSLLELIDANYTFVNDALAEIYGISGVTGAEMRLVKLSGQDRGGVLGMAAVLTATSQPLRTSPVLRGKWVLEQLLGEGVPAPPPNVPQLPADDAPQPDGLTMRARLEAHRANPDCAACHSRMDPIGFGLENFDPIGRWRTEQTGQPIDAQGVLPSGEKFNGPRELKQILLNRKDDFARNLSRKMLGYALGRTLTQYDECVVQDCLEALQQNDYRPSALFNQIAMSYPFLHRYGGGAAAGDTD
ncbi:MAG: DUF1592 domain-containing protein [Candidatus Hydrogenedentota bacterium]